MMKSTQCAKALGFTLIELVITVTIVAIFATIAVPAMRHLILTQYVRSGASNLQAALFYARSEAIKRAANVQVVPASGAWTNGWTAKLADGTILRSQNALSSELSSIPGSTITYLLNGRVTATPGQLVFQTADSTVTARCVVVDLSGRPSVVYDMDGDPTNGCN